MSEDKVELKSQAGDVIDSNAEVSCAFVRAVSDGEKTVTKMAELPDDKVEEATIEENIAEGMKDIADAVEECGAERPVFGGFSHDGIVVDESEKIEEAARTNLAIGSFDDSFESFKKYVLENFGGLINQATDVCSCKGLLPGQLSCIRLRASKMIKLVEALKDIK